IDDLVDARVSNELIQFYRALVSETKGKTEKTLQGAKQGEPDLLPGTVSRLNAFVPERIAHIQHLERELLAQAEARHKKEVEELVRLWAFGEDYRGLSKVASDPPRGCYN